MQKDRNSIGESNCHKHSQNSPQHTLSCKLFQAVPVDAGGMGILLCAAGAGLAMRKEARDATC